MEAKHVHDSTCLTRAAAEHICYEVSMMCAMARPTVYSANAAVAGSALLEAYLIHVRNVDEFLTLPRAEVRWREQVVAAHFFDDAFEPPEGLDQATRNEISRKIVHIFCDRERGENWSADGDVARFARHLLVSFRAFLAQLQARHPERVGLFAGIANAEEVLAAAESRKFVFGRVWNGELV
jgi:hypothetical protein